MFCNDISKAIALLQELQSHYCVDLFSDLLQYKLYGLNSTLESVLRSFELGRQCQDTQLNFLQAVDEDDCVIHSVIDEQLQLPIFQEYYESSLENELCSGDNLVQVVDNAIQVTSDKAVQVKTEKYTFGDFQLIVDGWEDKVDVLEVDQGWRSVRQGYSRQYADMKQAAKEELTGFVDDNYFSVLDRYFL